MTRREVIESPLPAGQVYYLVLVHVLPGQMFLCAEGFAGSVESPVPKLWRDARYYGRTRPRDFSGAARGRNAKISSRDTNVRKGCVSSKSVPPVFGRQKVDFLTLFPQPLSARAHSRIFCPDLFQCVKLSVKLKLFDIA